MTGQAKHCDINARPKAVGDEIFGRFSNVDKCRPEVADDVIARAAVGGLGLDVRAKFDDPRLNNYRIIRLFGRLHPFYAQLCSI